MMPEKDFTKYDAAELAQETSFIRWVREADEEAVRFWEEWVEAHPGHAEVVTRARKLVESLRFEEPPVSGRQIDRLWEKIEAGTGGSSPQKSGRRRTLRWLGYAAAACAALLLGVYLWNYETVEVIRTARGERLVYYLPDSSVVELNAETTLRFRPKRWDLSRELKLEGEAFFDVRQGAPFTVETAQGKVQVLGTSFNVRSRPLAFVVDCFTGQVAVELTGSETRSVLRPGSGARITAADSLEVFAFELENRAGWRRGQIYFENELLGQVLDELARQFDVQIRSGEDIRERRFNGFFRLSELDSALYDVTWPMNLEYRREGGTVVIE